MLIGARTGAWSGGEAPVREYVQDGLFLLEEDVGGASAPRTVYDISGKTPTAFTIECCFTDRANSGSGFAFSIGDAYNYTQTVHTWCVYRNNGGYRERFVINYNQWLGGVAGSSADEFRGTMSISSGVKNGDPVVAYINGQMFRSLTTTYTRNVARALIEAGIHAHSFRLYNRILSDTEIAANYAVDKARFGLP